MKQQLIFSSIGSISYINNMIQQQNQPQPAENPPRKDSVYLQLLFFYIYFMQGIIFSISSTMPYIYPELPSYTQMSLFFASLFPWSLKFLVSPFLEKYTSMSYGKRKTWLIISKILAVLLLYLASRFTDYTEINTFAWLLILINFIMMLHNIASESLSIKHFRNKEKIGILQILGDYGGAGIGGLMMMKLTNMEFAETFHLSGPIMAPSGVMIIYAIMLLSSIPVVHFCFTERRLKSEDVSNAKDLSQIILYNKIFFDFDSKYFRLAVFLLLYMLGINFYLASYEYKLIQLGFSRDTYNTIENSSMLVMVGVTLFMDDLACFQGRERSLMIIFTMFIVNILLMLTVFPTEVWAVWISVFLNEFLYAWRKYIIFQVLNSLPLHGVAGMYLTTLTSLNQFAEVKTLHSEVISLVGVGPCLIFGVVFQVCFMLGLRRMDAWIEEGKLEIDKDIMETDEEKYVEDELEDQV